MVSSWHIATLGYGPLHHTGKLGYGPFPSSHVVTLSYAHSGASPCSAMAPHREAPRLWSVAPCRDARPWFLGHTYIEARLYQVYFAMLGYGFARSCRVAMAGYRRLCRIYLAMSGYYDPFSTSWC